MCSGTRLADSAPPPPRAVPRPVLKRIVALRRKTLCRLALSLTPNPPKDTDGRREESGRGVRELQGK